VKRVELFLGFIETKYISLLLYIYVMIEVSKKILLQLEYVLKTLSNEEYTASLEIFSGASIAQHTRHILEFYVCLITNCECDIINYDLRKRDKGLEQDLSFCLTKITEINKELNNLNSDKNIVLEAVQGGKIVKVNTTLNRELLYAVEHTVHHMAIIKMGILLNYPSVIIPDNFGVAESTIQYKSICAQ